ncbi:MAG: M24 family metallopeptidase [bacterium]
MSLLAKLEEEDRLIRPIIAEALPQVDCFIQIMQEEFAKKWAALQAELKQAGFDLGYITGSELDRSDGGWIAGIYYPQIERYGVFIGQEEVPVVVAGSEGGHVVEEMVELSGAKVALFRPFQISDEEYLGVDWKDLDTILSEVSPRKKPRKVAVLSPADVIPHSQIQLLVDKFGAENVRIVPELLQLLKYDKTDRELLIMKHANIIADAAMRGMLAVLKPGATELQVAAVGDRIMKYLGASRTGFVTIVTSGDRNYTIIGSASHKVIQDGEMVALGVSPTFNGYHGIIRRTVKVGSQPYNNDQKVLMEAVEGLYKVIMEATIEAAKESLPSNTIDRAGREYLRKIRIKTLDGGEVGADELPPYTFIHNTGTSECQEGYGAVTPHTERLLGKKVALMIDVALKGFRQRGKPLLDGILYAVIEDAFWVRDGEVGVYNKLPLNVQHLVGNNDPLGDCINPYYKEFRP